MELTRSTIWIVIGTVLFQVTLADLTDDPICNTYSHTTLTSGRTCCNGTSILSGLNKNTEAWIDCQNIKSPTGEKSIDAFWRVYTCAISKMLPSGNSSISLLGFAKIVSSDYPDFIQKPINYLINNFAGATNQSWLTGEVPLTDYKTIDKIRALYFDIEQKVCEDLTESKPKMTDDMTCSYLTESFHRDADCCGNRAIPFRYASKSAAQTFDPTTCKKTLDPLLTKIQADDEQEQIALTICRFACYLVEKSFISIDDLIKIRSPNPPLIEGVISGALPYLPSGTQKKLAEKSLRDFNGTTVMGELSEFLGRLADPLNTTKLIENQEELYGCYALNNVYETNLVSDLTCDE